jgi:hypothetical protein
MSYLQPPHRHRHTCRPFVDDDAFGHHCGVSGLVLRFNPL